MTHRTITGLRRGAALALAVALVAGGAATAQAADAGSTGFVVEVEGRVPTLQQLRRSLPSVDIRSVTALGAGIAAVEVRSSRSNAQQAAALEASPLVADAAPDRRFTRSGTTPPRATNDAYFPQQWDLWDSASTKRAGGYGVDAPRAWRTTIGSPGVVVAVLDTGITPHPDLDGARIAAGYDFVSEEEGVDTGDGDGWDADPTDEGDACPELGETSSWHGTFVTGEIVAQAGRSGVVGQARGVTLLPVRVLGACGGSESDTIAAIEWASGGTVAGVPANPQPAKVISMSLGSADGPCSAALQVAVDDATARGAVVIAAAGNEGAPIASTSPANCRGVVGVAASTRAGTLASYSNHGTAAGSPTIAAPGGSSADPVIGDTWTSTTSLTAARNRPAIGSSEGTSMAAPRVTAAVALLLSVAPGLAPADVTARLVRTATPFSVRARCTVTRCGAGIVNAGDLVGGTRLFVHATRTTVTGTPAAGRLLVAHAGTWRAAPQRVTYRWLRDGRAIAGADARTYRLRAKDAGHRISVRVRVERKNTVPAAARSAVVRVTR